MQSIVDILKENHQTIATMESCTGGALADAITSIEGSSSIFKFGAVTYSNEYKIKMGVSENTISQYSVYSAEVAQEMAKQISLFTNSNYGVGITGKINKEDPNNQSGENNVVFISIYQNENDSSSINRIQVPFLRRSECKKIIIGEVEKMLLSILKEKEK